MPMIVVMAMTVKISQERQGIDVFELSKYIGGQLLIDEDVGDAGETVAISNSGSADSAHDIIPRVRS